MDHIHMCPRGLPDPRLSAPRQPGLAAARTCSKEKCVVQCFGNWCWGLGYSLGTWNLETGSWGLRYTLGT